MCCNGLPTVTFACFACKQSNTPLAEVEVEVDVDIARIDEIDVAEVDIGVLETTLAKAEARDNDFVD